MRTAHLSTIQESQLALLVDGDNLTGQSWPSLLERASDLGHVALARLYMDFQALRDGGLSARSAGFELVHVLAKRSADGFKSMVDVALATDAMSVLYENPNITTFVIGTGDADFIPLIRHWKRHGKRIIVMSNEAKLSRELRNVADDVITFMGGRKKRAARAASAKPLTSSELKKLIVRTSGGTRLTDRETNQPLVRVDWLYEQLEKDVPGFEELVPDERRLVEIIGEIPEFEPLDARSRTFLVGDPGEAMVEPGADAEEGARADTQTFEIFAEFCREILPPDGSWLPAPSVLNEGKRLLEDGAGMKLPVKRPTGWFKSLLERTEGIEVQHNDRGHMEVRRA